MLAVGLPCHTTKRYQPLQVFRRDLPRTGQHHLRHHFMNSRAATTKWGVTFQRDVMRHGGRTWQASQISAPCKFPLALSRCSDVFKMINQVLCSKPQQSSEWRIPKVLQPLLNTGREIGISFESLNPPFQILDEPCREQTATTSLSRFSWRNFTHQKEKSRRCTNAAL